MRNKYLKRADVRRITGHLLRGAEIPDLKVEEMVNASDLFVRILTDVRHQRQAARSFEKVHATSFKWHHGFASASAVSALLVVAVGAWALVNLRSDTDIANIPEVGPSFVKPALLEDISNSSGIPVVAAINRKPQKVISKKATKPVIVQTTSEDEPFQRIALTGDSPQFTESDRIIRVELPRTSLFAMGVNVAVENEGDRVKAELLLSQDGIMKGVRLARF